MISVLLLASMGLLTAGGLAAEPAARQAAVDDRGVLRWQDDQSEVALFGVNYYVPFSIDYQLLKARGLDHERAIRDDLTHMARLGLNVIRLHCWDRELSDHEGNLRDNEHLRLLDYLIAQAKERGIYSVMTPIAWWPSPEGGGFSDLYTMPQMTSDPQARRAQCNYLQQYLNHVNRYTGLAYKDDPAIVALELINEPLYPPGITEERITEYINALCQAVQSTGCRKPIFYNCWGGHFQAAAQSMLDGVSFGWYPTGLCNGQMLRGNYLASVNDYPSMRDPVLVTKAKIVYEFDAADTHGAVMYPAMARALRSGGAQIATQFQYDPMCIAAGNPNWQTHYLNLVYTPRKALSFGIAAEAFRRTPRLAQFGPYPQSCRFGDFRISYEEDLSELVTADTFMYANDTQTAPPAPDRLERIWGCGSSPVVSYDGTGAYFLHRLRRAPGGAWSLELYPDAVMVSDPYVGGASEKVRVLWEEHMMRLRLPDLGDRFRVRCLSHDRPEQVATEGTIRVLPGVYVLYAGDDPPPPQTAEFVAAPSSDAPPTAWAGNPTSWREGYDYPVQATVAMTGDPECSLYLRPAGNTEFQALPMTRVRAYEYRASVPAALMTPGRATYYITAQTEDRVVSFPGGHDGHPAVVDLAPPPALALLTVSAHSPLPAVRYGGPEGKSARATVVAGRDPGTHALRLEADGFGAPPSCASTEWKPAVVPADLSAYNAVRFVARGGPDTSAVEISLVQSDGNAFGYDVPLAPGWREQVVPLSQLRPMWQTATSTPDLALLDHLTLVFGAWLYPDLAEVQHTVDIQSVELVRQPELWEVMVAARDTPVVLAEPADRPLQTHGRPATIRPVPGMDSDRTAVRVAVNGFDAEPDATSFRIAVPEEASCWREEMARARAVVIKARAGTPQTTRLELVLLEADGSAWGTMDVPLTTQWQAIRIPLSDFWYFRHWNPPTRDRGGAGDHVRPQDIQAVNICFGAWLYGADAGKPHAIEVQDVSLVQD